MQITRFRGKNKRRFQNTGLKSIVKALFAFGVVVGLQLCCRAEWSYNPDGSGTNTSVSGGSDGETVRGSHWGASASGHFSGSFGPSGVYASGDGEAGAQILINCVGDILATGAAMSGDATSQFDWVGTPGSAEPVDFHIKIDVVGYAGASGDAFYGDPAVGVDAIGLASSIAYATGAASVSDTAAGGGARAGGDALGGYDCPDNNAYLEGDDGVTFSEQSNFGYRVDTSWRDGWLFPDGCVTQYWAESEYEISVEDDYTTTGGESSLVANVHLEVGVYATAATYGEYLSECNVDVNAGAIFSGMASLSISP